LNGSIVVFAYSIVDIGISGDKFMKDKRAAMAAGAPGIWKSLRALKNCSQNSLA